ncbi:MAG: CRISPR-associated endonuclease Cas2 [Candidatus Doudnabacteria bacterium]|nr:CRISPR-associated endonuclease Cas2 [Candidatus Doudnabacteria bacterium]
MRHKQSINQILDGLVEFLETMANAKGKLYFYTYGPQHNRSISESSYFYQIRKFQKAGLIRKSVKQNKPIYALTPKAKELLGKPSVKTDRNDGMSTIVMFDIPESQNRSRYTFRRYLLRNGYTQIQKSVFIAPFHPFKELQQMITELGIDGKVMFISGKIDYFNK